METLYANTFIDAWVTVLESFCTKQIIGTDIIAPKESPDERDISVFMGLVGDLQGQVYMSMDVETGKVLATDMLGGMELDDADEMVTSAVGELCNMIMGNACSNISQTHTSVDITPPTVTSNQSMSQLDLKASYSIAIHLEDLKEINFNVAMAS